MAKVKNQHGEFETEKKIGRSKNCRGCHKPKTKCDCGRPTVLTEDVLRKLEDAFCLGCTDNEAALYANISPTALYKYCRENPAFAKRKELLKERPMLQARQTIINSLKTTQGAQWYAERKRKDEFSSRSEHTGADGDPLFDYSEESKKRLTKYL